ncbi:MAG: LCP family protein [Chloroflexota bacterium]|nr:LCP family protein [Chloroflexota bacterium]
MGSDYKRWKKRRDAERARRKREAEEAVRPVAPPREWDVSPDADDPYGAARRTYQDYIPPSTRREPKRRETVRGCVGCLGLLLGGTILLAAFLLIAGTLYWRQIEQRGQVNVLILGIDERPNEGENFRSDTMILAGFDPREREVAVLSIPRDLWVNIPGIGENRINTAHFFGGPSLAKETVRNELGVPLHYYVNLNFNGFVSIIDAMGGITLDVPEALRDENYPTPDYGVTTIEIPAGEQQMDGATALIYARSRYSTSDFDRSRRQQEIIAAVQRKMAAPSTWLNTPAIFRAVSGTIATDIPPSEWPALGLILLRSEVQHVPIGPEVVQVFVTDNGALVLLPDWSQINPILAQYFE